MTKPQIRQLAEYPSYGATSDGRIWRVVPPPEGQSWGNVAKAKRVFPYALAPLNIGGGRLAVHLSEPHVKTLATVASLVAQAWLPEPDIPRIVRFKDGDCGNCAARNLAWGARKPGPSKKRRGA